MKLPEDLIDVIRSSIENEDASKMYTVVELGKQWKKYGKAIIYNYADEEGLDEPSEEKARAWFINALAGNLATVGAGTLRNRMRVFRNVVDRGLYEGNEVISYWVWMLLLRNLPEEEGLVDITELDKRLSWYYDEGMPTTRTIEDYVRDNGHQPEWETLWNRIVKNANRMLELDIPGNIKDIITRIKKVDQPKFEAPAVIYKAPGYTGAQKERR